MVGQTSDGRDVVIGVPHPSTHRVSLVEHHEVTESLPTGRCSTMTDVDAIVLRCHAAAISWADDAGLEIRGIEPFSVSAMSAGVRFEITIGTGIAHDIDGESPRWGWSERWQHWYDLLHRVARGYRQSVHIADADPADAQVIQLFGGRAVVGAEYGID